MRFLHPRGWSYYATLRRKLRWNAWRGLSHAAPPVLRDFVIVAELEVELAGGFSVLTGETGAGKSILIDALQLALGSRGDAPAWCAKAPRAPRSAPSSTAHRSRPGSTGPASPTPTATLLLRRTIDAQGKSRAWISGSAGHRRAAARDGRALVDIHGQHAWQSLTRRLGACLLDAGVAASTLAPLAQRLAGLADAPGVDEAGAARSPWERERERLRWQIGELDKLAPGRRRWDELDAEHRRLAHAQALMGRCARALDAVTEADARRRAPGRIAIDWLQVVGSSTPRWPACRRAAGRAGAAAGRAHARRLPRRADPDPQRLQALDARLSAWMSLARALPAPPAELLALLAAGAAN